MRLQGKVERSLQSRSALSICQAECGATLERSLYVFLLTLLLAISASAEDEVVIRTTDFAPSPDSAFSIEGKAQLAVYHAFREKYPHIQPQANPMGLQFEGAAGEAPLLMSIAGGTAPNVIHVNGRQSGSYVARGFLHPLDDFVDTERTAEQARTDGDFDANIMYLDELRARIKPQVWDAVVREGPDGKTHVYYLPFSYWVRVVAYNKALFQEAGLDPETGYPKTWDEFHSIAGQLHQPDKESYGVLVDTGGGASWIALPFFYANGSRIVQYDEAAGDWRAAFNDPRAVEAADFYLQLLKNGRTEDAWHLWQKGRVGMVLLYANDTLINMDSNISGLNPSEVGLVQVPQAPSGGRTTELHMRGVGICATTTDPAQIDAAWKFIRFVASPEAEKAVIRTYVENGYGRFINPEKLKAHGYPEYVKAVPKQWADTLAASLADCEPEPYAKNCGVFILRASKPLEVAIDEEISAIPDKEERLARLQVLYDNAVAETNEKMLGHIPEEVMATRRMVAAIVLAVMVAGFLTLGIYVWKLFTPKEKVRMRGKGWKAYLVPYALLAPAILSILIFNYYPLLAGGVMAFQDYNVMGGSSWVGLDNFAMVLYDPAFWISMLRTFEYVFWSLILVFASPIVLAVILAEIPRAGFFFRIVYYLPAVVSGVVVMLMWKMFFDPSPDGTFNQILGMIGIGPQRWLQDSSLAMISILLPMGWAGLGPGCLIYLAALKTVPEDLYEAAAIDGAGFLRRLWYVTIPTIRPLILIQLIFVLIGAFQSADNVLIMTGGGPGDATNVIGLEIFYSAYVYLKFGSAVAVAWILGFLLIGLTMLQMKRISRMEFTAGA